MGLLLLGHNWIECWSRLQQRRYNYYSWWSLLLLTTSVLLWMGKCNYFDTGQSTKVLLANGWLVRVCCCCYWFRASMEEWMLGKKKWWLWWFLPGSLLIVFGYNRVLVVLFYGVPGAVRKEKRYFWLEHGRKSGALYVFFFFRPGQQSSLWFWLDWVFMGWRVCKHNVWVLVFQLCPPPSFLVGMGCSYF